MPPATCHLPLTTSQTLVLLQGGRLCGPTAAVDARSGAGRGCGAFKFFHPTGTAGEFRPFDTSTQRDRNRLLFRVSTSHGVGPNCGPALKPVNKEDRHHIRQEVGSAFSTRPGWQGSRCSRRGQARRHGRATRPQHTRTRSVASGARHQGSPRRRSDGPPTHVARPAAALDSGRSCAGIPSRYSHDQ